MNTTSTMTTEEEGEEYTVPSTPIRRGWIPTYTQFCGLLQVCNAVMLCVLIALAGYEYVRIGRLETHLAAAEGQISNLKEEVREKQEGQIEQLHEEVEEASNLTFFSLAGTFTLLTCLISMFHMSSHVQNMKEPTIQRKILAILWMSPIYSVTSFFSLIYPPSEGYFAIIKDFYESYCIYNFLSFLIAVLGQGEREKAVEVLAKHAEHLKRPYRCLSRWYNPPPETSDQAKANAVITECQILAMQFVFIRPLTTVIYVLYRLYNDGTNGGYSEGHDATIAPTTVAGSLTRWLQDGNDTFVGSFSPTTSPVEDVLGTFAPTLSSTFDATDFPTGVPVSEDIKEATINYFKSFSFLLAMVVNVSVFFAFAGLLKFYHAVRDDLKMCRPWPKFLTIKGIVFLTFWQGLAILIFVNLAGNDEDPSAKARHYQNTLICCEMVLFSISHWCVFPAEEWEKDYQPNREMPGIGIQDFVSDVGYIVESRRNRKPRRGTRRRSRKDHGGGMYHRPVVVASLESDDDGYEHHEVENTNRRRVVNAEREVVQKYFERPTSFDNEGSSSRGDDESDDDMELL